MVDASVAVKWLVPENASDAAERVLAASDDLIAPDLLLAEVANALRKKSRRGELTAAEAAEAFAILCTLRLELHSTGPLVRRALDLAAILDISVYDCVYIALAEAEGGRLVSDDKALVARLRLRRGLPRAVGLVSFRGSPSPRR